jgi:hypothetical protein
VNLPLLSAVTSTGKKVLRQENLRVGGWENRTRFGNWLGMALGANGFGMGRTKRTGTG